MVLKLISHGLSNLGPTLCQWNNNPPMLFEFDLLLSKWYIAFPLTSHLWPALAYFWIWDRKGLRSSGTQKFPAQYPLKSTAEGSGKRILARSTDGGEKRLRKKGGKSKAKNSEGRNRKGHTVKSRKVRTKEQDRDLGGDSKEFRAVRHTFTTLWY